MKVERKKRIVMGACVLAVLATSGIAASAAPPADSAVANAGVPKPDGADRVLAVAARLVGGEWISETKSGDGTVFRVRNIVEFGPDGRSLIGKGWLGDAQGMYLHGAASMWKDPATGKGRFMNISEKGAVAAGDLLLVGESTVRWEWNQTDADGKVTPIIVDMAFDSMESYQMQINIKQEDGSLKRVGDIPIQRVAQSGPEFKKLKMGETAGGFAGDAPAGEDAWFVQDVDRSRRVEHEAVVNASPERIFEMITTSEGWKSFLGVNAKIELRPGGPFELYFSMEPPAGARGSEGCRVLAYSPDEMLSFSWNAPPNFPAEREQRTIVTISLRAETGGGATPRTRLRLVQTGFGKGESWGQVHEYFQRAWGVVVGELVKWGEKSAEVTK